MMTDRNRAEGWQYAKVSGHENEALVADLTKCDSDVQQRLLRCAKIYDAHIVDVQYGGLCETDVDCIFSGEKTKSKTDMWLFLSDGRRLNVSIKKDEGGQVFLIGIDRFIRGFEAQYHKQIPNEVKRAIQLYFGSAEDTEAIIRQYSGVNRTLELRKHRLVADTLYAYNSYFLLKVPNL